MDQPVKYLFYKVSETTNPPVFFGAAAIVVLFAGFGAAYTDLAGEIFRSLQEYIVSKFGWFYVLSASLLLVLAIYLLFSRFGSIRLGGDDAKPDFTYPSWFAMLMAAGMGIGLVFFGVAEPMLHYLSPPLGQTEARDTVQTAMRFTYYHWGLHPWAIYTAIALPLAYFHFRHKLPLAPRSLLYPLLGDRINGPVGHFVDILCTVGTLFGVATSLGFGAIQINTGLDRLTGLVQSVESQIAIIAVITLIATVSVVSGVKVGIRMLSRFNIGLAIAICLFVLIAGPTIDLLELFISSLGTYLQFFPDTSLWIDWGQRTKEWQKDWTLFYWAWWISWSPFVGIFTARISKGRTIREFILTVLIVPTLGGFFWFAVVGGTGLHLEIFGEGGVAEATRQNTSLALFAVLEELPFSTVTSIAAVLLITVFFITSSDSGSLVDDMVTSGGHPHPPKAQRVFWAFAEGAVAAVLLLAGGLQALRTASLTTGLPMAVFLLVAVFGVIKALRVDYATAGRPELERLHEDSAETGEREESKGGSG